LLFMSPEDMASRHNEPPYKAARNTNTPVTTGNNGAR